MHDMEIKYIQTSYQMAAATPEFKDIDEEEDLLLLDVRDQGDDSAMISRATQWVKARQESPLAEEQEIKSPGWAVLNAWARTCTTAFDEACLHAMQHRKWATFDLLADALSPSQKLLWTIIHDHALHIPLDVFQRVFSGACDERFECSLCSKPARNCFHSNNWKRQGDAAEINQTYVAVALVNMFRKLQPAKHYELAAKFCVLCQVAGIDHSADGLCDCKDVFSHEFVGIESNQDEEEDSVMSSKD